MSNCFKHIFDEAVDACRACQNHFCGECLVFTLGPQHPPYCVPCALVASSGARRSARSLARR
jgi:hypothetical protein